MVEEPRESAQNTNITSDEIAESINEFNQTVQEIASLEMRLLFKQARASVAKNFSDAVKQKYGLEIKETQICSQLICDKL